MSKYKIKDGKGKARVSYRQRKDGKLKMKMVSVVLEKATATQLTELFALKHPFIVEVKDAKKAETK